VERENVEGGGLNRRHLERKNRGRSARGGGTTLGKGKSGQKGCNTTENSKGIEKSAGGQIVKKEIMALGEAGSGDSANDTGVHLEDEKKNIRAPGLNPSDIGKQHS